MQLEQFEIYGLNGMCSVTIKFRDNTLILVGENGQGKSTIVGILYNLLACRWKDLLKYNFDSIGLRANTKEIRLTKKEIRTYVEFESESPVHQSSKYHGYVRRYLKEKPESLSDENVHRIISRRFGISLAVARQITVEVQEEIEDVGVRKVPISEHFIKSSMPEQVIYLPTYRRVEQDISSIMPKILDEYSRYLPSSIRDQISQSMSNTEVIKFGMEDVSSLINSHMVKLKESIRESMNKLSITFLRNAINNNMQEEQSPGGAISESDIEDVLRRTSSDLLSPQDKEVLKTSLLAAENQKGQRDNKISLYFMRMLSGVMESQRSIESNVRSFVYTCNKYLSGKEMVFDDVNFKVAVRQAGKINFGDAADQDIELKHLSSGEKQIVSLFSHVYLGESGDFIMVIDEPELSLSVDWQKRFLVDVKSSQRCRGLIAVTHSPFIFENELDKYAYSINEFMAEWP